jgi:hypothetical protein
LHFGETSLGISGNQPQKQHQGRARVTRLGEQSAEISLREASKQFKLALGDVWGKRAELFAGQTPQRCIVEPWEYLVKALGGFQVQAFGVASAAGRDGQVRREGQRSEDAVRGSASRALHGAHRVTPTAQAGRALGLLGHRRLSAKLVRWGTSGRV